MKPISFMCFAICLLNISCNKQANDPTKTCFKGRYVGEGCWPIIQVLKPLDERFNNNRWQNKDSILVGVGTLPDKYKNGQPFYFTVDSIYQDPIHTDYCSTTGYMARINSYSDSACEMPDQNSH